LITLHFGLSHDYQSSRRYAGTFIMVTRHICLSRRHERFEAVPSVPLCFRGWHLRVQLSKDPLITVWLLTAPDRTRPEMTDYFAFTNPWCLGFNWKAGKIEYDHHKLIHERRLGFISLVSCG